MKKLNLFLLFVGLALIGYSQEDINPCGQLPHVNPTVKAKCANNIQTVFSEGLPNSFSKAKSYESTFKLILDCNGRIDMVIYKKGNFTEIQQKHFLLKLNTLKDWTAGQLDGKDVTTTVYFTINVDNRIVSYKQY